MPKTAPQLSKIRREPHHDAVLESGIPHVIPYIRDLSTEDFRVTKYIPHTELNLQDFPQNPENEGSGTGIIHRRCGPAVQPTGIPVVILVILVPGWPPGTRIPSWYQDRVRKQSTDNK